MPFEAPAERRDKRVPGLQYRRMRGAGRSPITIGVRSFGAPLPLCPAPVEAAGGFGAGLDSRAMQDRYKDFFMSLSVRRTAWTITSRI